MQTSVGGANYLQSLGLSLYLCLLLSFMPGFRWATRVVLELKLAILIAVIFTINLSCQQSSAGKRTAAGTQPSPSDSVRFMRFAEAESAIKAFSANLPEELVHAVAAHDESEWDKYVRGKDSEVRDRLHRGDLDTLANLLLFGTSYTGATPLTPELLKRIHADPGGAGATDLGSKSLLKRLDDLTAGLARPGTNERLKYFHDLLQRQQYRFETPAELFKVKQFLGSNLLHMLHEDTAYAAALAEARRVQENEFQKRSQVFARRGISLDTSLFPNYAIEEALIHAKQQGLLPAHVMRVGIIGPGLDVVNKDEGLDFYPEQTIQPFLLADSLVKLGLADPQQLQITTFDISRLVNQHIAAIRTQAEHGAPYTVQLPIRSDIDWTPQALAYWKQAGMTLGHAAVPIKSSSPTSLRYKAVVFPASEALRIRPVDLDVIYQKDEIPESERLDLIVATNMFVYYGGFEQALAESNLASMLRAGGLVLTNDVLPELPDLPLRAASFHETLYSSRPNDGDRVVVYMQRK
jgi:hypothetical protein